MRYDCIIIGSGPAGLSAAMNLSIHKKNILWFGNRMLSDKVEKAECVENYPGLPSISGQELKKAFLTHKDAMGLEITDKVVSTIYNMGDYYNVMAENEFYETNTILLATGVVAASQYQGEAEFVGRGVSYCATCDGMFFIGRDVLMVGGGNSAAQEALYLKNLGCNVKLVHRRDELRCEHHLQKALEDNDIEVLWNSTIQEIKGEMAVNSVTLLRDGKEEEIGRAHV